MRIGFLLIFISWLGCQAQNDSELPPYKNMHFDYFIQDASIIGGDGEYAEPTDVLINDDSIFFIGEVEPGLITFSEKIAADGRVLAPGFIDLHAHGDPAINAHFNNFLAMGVTSIVLGQDGSSPDQNFSGKDAFSTWIQQMEDLDLQLNIIPFVGHGTLMIKNQLSGPATTAQLNAMLEYLDAAFAAGAWGLSMGLEYLPGLNAPFSDLEMLAQKVGSHQGMIMSHMRSEDNDQIEAAISELAALGKYCQVHISHLKVVYGKGKNRAIEILSLIEEKQMENIAITADTYPYLASYTGLGIVFPKWAKTRADFEKSLLHREHELRAFLRQKVKQRNGPEATLICTGPYTGLTLQDAAAKEGISFVDLLIQLGPQGTSGAYFVMDKELQETFICDPEIAICTDGSPTMRHPRGYGSYAKMIAEYVQNKQLDLATAIYKMSTLPSEILGLPRRGKVREGYIADLVLFNPENVKSAANYVNARVLSQGFDYVFVNGKIAWQNQHQQSPSAGRVLKKK